MRRLKVRWSRCGVVCLIGVVVALAWRLEAEVRARRAAEAARDELLARSAPEQLLLGAVPGTRWVIEDYELSSSPPVCRVSMVARPEVELTGRPLTGPD